MSLYNKYHVAPLQIYVCVSFIYEVAIFNNYFINIYFQYTLAFKSFD